ncbi:peptidase domain-containing ABC transporter [Planctomicrobium sp. SH661]|uniref:peptidase domain-containing ABC transporter n=1 Tax=Planctomicrobium sp. SH661 TaxID=3448124 RepID=UPI003F5B036A
MIAHPPQSENDHPTAAAAVILEAFALESGRPADRGKFRRALEEAVEIWPGDESTQWWKWIIEASVTLELKSKVIDCTFPQLVEIVRDGGRVILHNNEEYEGWYAVMSAPRQRFRLLTPLGDPSDTQLSKSELRRKLEKFEEDQVLRVVVIEPQPEFYSTEDAHAGEQPPFSRLLSLLHAERGDIWVVFVFAMVTGLLAMATPLAVESLVNTVAFGRFMQPVVVLSLILFAFLAFMAALRALQTYVVEIIQRRIFARVAADLAYRLPRVRIDAYEGHNGRELVNRFFDVVTVQKVTAQMLLDALSLVLITLIGMCVLAFYHPWLLGFDVILLCLIAIAIFVLGRGAVTTSIKESKKKYNIAAFLEDLAACPLAFKCSGATEFAMERADRLTFEYLEARRKHFNILMRQIIFALFLQAVSSTVLLGMGGWLVISGQLTLGQLVAAELIVSIVVASFAKMGKHLEGFYDLLASVDKLGVLFDLPTEKSDGLGVIRHDGPVHVTVHDVSYGPLKPISLDIRPGERIAICGATGHGKSLLLDLLYGLRLPASGYVAINDIDVRNLRPDLLRRVAAMAADVEIFQGTVSENVHLERPEVSSSHIREALDKVGLLDVILAYPDGLETELSADGYPLTLPQARKLVLARAIANDPKLLLIDGTLDTFPDAEGECLMEMLCDRSQPWTLLCVSGRESLQRMADRIVKIGTGEIYVNRSAGNLVGPFQKKLIEPPRGSKHGDHP